MKHYILLVSILALIGCNSGEKQQTEVVQPKTNAAPVNLDATSFEELYTKIDPKEMNVNIFKLLNEDWSVVTAGNETDYNSMIASWGGYGIVFEKPVSWLFLNASRFTLEKIKAYDSFTLSYLDSTYVDQKMIFGKQSGRDTDKMKETSLHPVKTPDGLMTYKEAYLIVELKLESLMELNPDNFKTEDHKKFMIDGKEKGNGTNYHNMVTGIITNVWVRK